MLYKFNTNFGYYSIDIEEKNFRISKLNNFLLFSSRDILSKCKNKKFYNVIPYIERIDYSTSSFYSLCFVKAIEEKQKINVKQNVQSIRNLLLEFENINFCLLSLRNLYYITEDLVLINVCTEIIESIFSYFETITGHRLYHNFFTLGGFNQNFTIGNFEKTVNLIVFITKRVKYFLDIAIDLPSIKTRLEDLAIVEDEQGKDKICAYKRYLRLLKSLQKSVQNLKDLTVSDITFNVTELQNYDTKPSEKYNTSIISPRGTLSFAFETSENNLIQNLIINDPSTLIFKIMTKNLNKILVDDVNLAINSFFVSFLEIVK